jgi:Ser/Thr protein kinase RdoA (MazF antagonist)
MEKAIREQFNEEVLIKGLAKFGVKLKDSELIGGFENMVYSFTKDDKKYVLRISHSLHNSFHNISAELEFINFLNENNAPVATPIKSVHNNYVELLDESEPCFMATAFEFANGGRAPREAFMDPTFLEEYGKNIGLMHNLTKEFNPEFRRYDFVDEEFIKRAGEFLPEHDLEIKTKLDQVMEKINNIKKDKDSYGLIHTDVHAGNFFVDEDNNFTIFDFDDCCYKYFVSDIAIVLYYAFFMVPDHKEGMEFTFKNIMKGYITHNTLPDSSIENLGLFLQLRTIVIYIVLHRSFDQDKRPEWVQKYLEIFRPRILNNTPYVDLDFSKIKF